MSPVARKRALYALNALVILSVVVLVTFRLHEREHVNFRAARLIEKQTTAEEKKQSAEALHVPWRFHVEEDGFIFPDVAKGKEQYLTYEQLKGPWTKQILQFENAVVFAFLLKRVLLVPSILPFYSRQLESKDTFSMADILDFDLLSSTVRLEPQDNHPSMRVGNTNYSVCHDPRLGFWVDYIPSVENIQTWRILKAQYFYPVALNLQGAEKQYMCPGTQQYVERWGPPIHVKPVYRGILTELADRSEDLIIFQGDTLDTKHIRFFDRHRTKKAQELLLFYVRFSKEITQRTKRLAQLLGLSYNALLMDSKQLTETYLNYLLNEVVRMRFNLTSVNILVVGKNISRGYFDPLERMGFTMIFSDQFVRSQADFSLHGRFMDDEIHLLSLLLCAYATNFIGSHSSGDLYFVEHLRLQDATIHEGLLKDKVSVRWAKHTARDRADEHKVFVRADKGFDGTQTPNNTHSLEAEIGKHTNVVVDEKLSSVGANTKRLDKLSGVVCVFCNYVRYVTGKNGCPTLRRACGG